MAAVKIKVGSRPSGLDAAGWKKILLSNSLVTVRQNLRKHWFISLSTFVSIKQK